MKRTLFSFGVISIVSLPIIAISCNDDTNDYNASSDINYTFNLLKETFANNKISNSSAQTLRNELQRKNSGNEAEFITIMKIDSFSFPQTNNGTQIRWSYEGISENGYKDNGALFTIKFTVSKPGSYAASKQLPARVASKDYLSDSPEDQLNMVFKAMDKDNFVATGNQTKTSAKNMVNWFVPSADFETQLNYFGFIVDASNENFNYTLNGENIVANDSLRRVEKLTITITHKTQPELTKTTREFSISGYASLIEEDCYILIDELDDGLVFGSDITSTKSTLDLEKIYAGNEPIAHGENGSTVSLALGLPTEISEKLAEITDLRGTTITYHQVSYIDGNVGKQFTFKVKVAKSGVEKDFNFEISGNDYIPS